MSKAKIIGIGICLFLFSFSFTLGLVAFDTSEALAYCQRCNCTCNGLTDAGKLVSGHCEAVYCYRPIPPDYPCGYWCDTPTK